MTWLPATEHMFHLFQTLSGSFLIHDLSLITGVIARVIRRVPLVEKQLSSPPVFSGVCVTRSLVVCVCFVDGGLSLFFWPLCCLSFNLRILITPLYLQTLLMHCVKLKKYKS